MELCYENVRDYFKKYTFLLDTPFILNLMFLMVCSLKEIHQSGMLHLNLKLSNIMITNDQNIKFTNLYYSKEFSNKIEKFKLKKKINTINPH